MLSDESIQAIAARLGRTPAQVILRWHLQQGRIIIPKSVTPARIRENLDILDFTLTDADLTTIDALERDGRTGPHPADFGMMMRPCCRCQRRITWAGVRPRRAAMARMLSSLNTAPCASGLHASVAMPCSRLYATVSCCCE